MIELLLTPAMAADYTAFERWKASTDAHLIVKRERRPARRKAGHKAAQTRRMKEGRA